jgi:hypothetical protein
MKSKNNPAARNKFVRRIAPTSAALALLFIFLASGFSSRQVVRADEVHGEAIDSTPITPALATNSSTSTAAIGSSITNAPPASPPAPASNIPATLAAVQPVGAPPKIDGCLSVGFDVLASFDYDAPDTPVTNHLKPDIADKMIPDGVKALDGKKVVIRGYMLPLKVEGDKASEFLIMRSQSTCCFGVTPKVNEIINVKTTGKGLTATMDQPLNVEGTLHVGTLRDNGYIIGIYTLDAEKLVADRAN